MKITLFAFCLYVIVTPTLQSINAKNNESNDVYNPSFVVPREHFNRFVKLVLQYVNDAILKVEISRLHNRLVSSKMDEAEKTALQKLPLNVVDATTSAVPDPLNFVDRMALLRQRYHTSQNARFIAYGLLPSAHASFQLIHHRFSAALLRAALDSSCLQEPLQMMLNVIDYLCRDYSIMLWQDPFTKKAFEGLVDRALHIQLVVEE